MKAQLLTLFGLAVVCGPVLADAAKNEWERDMEQRLQRLEERTQSPASDPDEAQPKADTEEERANWFDIFELEGLIEVEASRVSPQQGGSTSDVNVATVELGVGAKVNPWVEAEILLLYEEETDNDGDLNVDTALITLADPQANWFIKAGRNTLPFGLYPTQMISDPLTLELGETSDTAIEAGYLVDGLEFSLFLFQGDQNDKVDNLGAQLGYETEIAGVVSRFNLGYLDNLAESDAIVDGAWVSVDDKMAAWVASVEFGIGPWTLIGEYLDVRDGFADAADQAPAAHNLELGYGFELGDLPANIAIGYQGTDDAEDANWELPEKRLIGTFSIELLEATELGIEFKRDEAYSGERENSVTAQLAVSF